MSKKIASAVALGLLSANSFAQSSVTLFGIVDAAVSRVSGTGQGSRTGLSSGGNAASRLGFRGAEDLGGGLSASFWLEGTINLDNGNAAGFTFTRRSTVSLSGSLGEIRLGRDYSTLFFNAVNTDPFGGRGVGQILSYDNFSYSSVRNSNAVSYFTPANLGGFFGQLQYAFGEAQSNVRNRDFANFTGARLGYAQGPAQLAMGYGRWRQVIGASDVAPLATGRDLRMWNLAGAYAFGPIKPSFVYAREEVLGAAPGNARLDSLMLGLTATAGLNEFRASVSRHDMKNSSNDFNKLALGYGYYLSKRTQLYATIARISNKGAATKSIAVDGLLATGVNPGGRSSGFDLGIRHAF